MYFIVYQKDFPSKFKKSINSSDITIVKPKIHTIEPNSPSITNTKQLKNIKVRVLYLYRLLGDCIYLSGLCCSFFSKILFTIKNIGVKNFIIAEYCIPNSVFLLSTPDMY